MSGSQRLQRLKGARICTLALCAVSFMRWEANLKSGPYSPMAQSKSHNSEISGPRPHNNNVSASGPNRREPGDGLRRVRTESVAAAGVPHANEEILVCGIVNRGLPFDRSEEHTSELQSPVH